MTLISYFRWFHRVFYRLRIYLTQLIHSYRYYYTKRLALCCDLRCGINYVGKNKTKFPHPVGIVIGIGVKVGYNCTIFQNVTIGTKTLFKHDYPILGDNVIVGANSVIIGDVIIGNNVVIGACTLVNIDLPENSIAVGNPIRIIGGN